MYLQGFGEPLCNFCIIEHWGGLIDGNGCRSFEISSGKGHLCVWIISRRELVVYIELHRIHSGTHTSGNFEQGIKIKRQLGLRFGTNLGVEKWKALFVNDVLNDGRNDLGESGMDQ